MKLKIQQIINQQLAESIQYYIFCNSMQSENVSYQTFPNTNLCFSIYKSNKIIYHQPANLCKVQVGSSNFTSRLWGFHEKIFNVSIDTAMDQVCILFHPCGIRNFTNIPYEVLIKSDDVFGMVFGKKGIGFLEQLFETTDTIHRVHLLERFLIRNQNVITRSPAVDKAMQRILKTGGNVKIEMLAKECGINNATLYNNFMSFMGQSPKDFIKTVRFRRALSLIKQQKKLSLTDISYSANYYDQSHFIKDFLQLTGYTPKEIRKRTVVEQDKLVWVNNS